MGFSCESGVGEKYLLHLHDLCNQENASHPIHQRWRIDCCKSLDLTESASENHWENYIYSMCVCIFKSVSNKSPEPSAHRNKINKSKNE